MTTSQVPEGSIVVTPSEVWTEVRLTRDAVRDLAHLMSTIPGQIQDQEARIRQIEQRMWSAMGVMAFLVVAATIAASLLAR